MKAAEGKIGRVFILRMDDGDEMPGSIETFAKEKGVRVGYVSFVGGIGAGKIVTGPRDPATRPVDPMMTEIENAHEVAAVGVLAPDEAGNPVLHMHGAFGRETQTLSGCMRPGVKTWLVGEVILYEILGTGSMRIRDEAAGFSRLEPLRRPRSESAEPTPAQAVARPEPKREEPAPVADTEHTQPIHLFNAELN